MQKPTFDPGLTQQYAGNLRRIINHDGSFNVQRRGTDWRDTNPYLEMVSTTWPRFFGVVILFYALTNTIFASIYFALGPDAISISDPAMGYGRFAQCFFFSSQTLTTVGFGVLAPRTEAANLVAALEALCGLLGFAVATGLLFGRVSRPSARIGFSAKALISPYQDITSFQFRMVNRRANSLIEPEATVMLMMVDRSDGEMRREFKLLTLERPKLMLFPLMWTVVHPIDHESPLWGKSHEDLKTLQAEFLILIKAWDETFSQTVHQRYSYRYSEVVWGGKYKPAFGVDSEGGLEVHVNRVGEHELKELPRLPLPEPE